MSQSLIDDSKQYCEDAYNPHGIDFNWCQEVLIDDGLFNNPKPFLNPTNCSIEFDPEYLHVYLLEDCPGTCEGEADTFGGTRAYSAPNLTLAHEIAHMLNLYHLDGCPSDLDPAWKLGDPLGVSDAGDFVLDTPIGPHAEPDGAGGLLWPIFQTANPCWIDWSESIGSLVNAPSGDYCVNTDGTPQMFPVNYGYELDSGGNMIYNPVWETNIMQGWWLGNCFVPVRSFTPGQATRMIQHLDGPHNIFVDNSNPPCPQGQVLPVLSQSMINSGAIITGDNLLDQDLIINTDVVFREMNLSVLAGVGITINMDGNLTVINSTMDANLTCSDEWSGIDVLPGSVLTMETVVIENASVGLDIGSTEIDLDFVGFIKCSVGMDVHYNSTRDNITPKDLNFVESPVIITDSTIKPFAIKCYKSPVTVTSSTGRHRLFLEQGTSDGRVTFDNSNLITENLDLLGLANCYFGFQSDILVRSGNEVDICWSLFDRATQWNDKIEISGPVNQYKIYGNQFTISDETSAISVSERSPGESSIIRNNIFEGTFAYNDFDSGNDNNVEFSCNHCHNGGSIPFKAAAGMITQGREDHPAGNKFYSTPSNSLDIDAATSFDYYYNRADPNLERPVGSVQTIAADYSGEDNFCLSEQEIKDQGAWDPFIDFGCNLNPYEWHLSICGPCPVPPDPNPGPIVPINPLTGGSNGRGDSGKANSFGSAAEAISSVVSNNDSRKEGELEVHSVYWAQKLRMQVADTSDADLSLRLLNVSGQTVFTRTIDEPLSETDLSFLPAGIYILQVIENASGRMNNQLIHLVN